MSNTPDHASRAHALLSASSSDRWINCPPSAIAAAGYPRQDTAYTREGTLAHEVAELCAREYSRRGFVTITDPNVTQEMMDCAEAYRDYIAELLTSDDAVVLLEQRVDFSPWVPEGFGTCDCIIIQGDTLTVVDYKFGQGVAVSAINNPQMRLYALGALNDFGLAYDVAHVETHIFQPRVNNISADRLTADDLIAWGDNIVKPAAKLAAIGQGAYKPGEHCRFCPHAGLCRELTQVCTKYVETHGMRAKVPTLAPWEVAEALRMEPLVSLWLKRVKDQALTTMLDGGEIPGFKVVAGRGSRDWADELEVAAALDKQGISREDYTKTELLTVAQLEKALGKKRFRELVGGHVLSKEGNPTIAPETDKRPAYDRTAEANKDFKED